MLRSCKYVAAWMAVAAVAVTVSWLGVRIGLAPALTAEAPVAIDVNRRYTEVHLGFAEVTPPPSPSASTSSPKPSRSATAKPAATRRPTPKTSASPSARQSTAATSSEDQTEYEISADGGTVTVAFSSTRVDAVNADPIPGYVAGYTRRSDTAIVIRLDGPSHSSVITAYWSDGPHARIAEEYLG
jgi:hypothetical protein